MKRLGQGWPGADGERKPQKVEQVFDDCGEDLSGLGACWVVESDSDEDEIESFSIYLGLNGSDFQPESPEEHAVQKRPGNYHYFPLPSQFLASNLHGGDFDDVAELCGELQKRAHHWFGGATAEDRTSISSQASTCEAIRSRRGLTHTWPSASPRSSSSPPRARG